MPELIAQGPRINDRWRRPLPAGQTVMLGRDGGDWAAPWEPHLSRRHAELTWRGGQLEVRRVPQAANPIFCRGDDSQHFSIPPGEHFIIGQTMFLVGVELAVTEAVESDPLQERAFRAEEPKTRRERSRHLTALAMLPDLLLAGPAERLARLARLLLAGIPGAEVAALVALDDADSPPRLIHCERRSITGGDLPLSRRLCQEAWRRQETVLHFRQGQASEQFTQADTLDWAFCTPVKGQTRCIYLTGRFRDTDLTTVIDDEQAGGLADEIPFAELVASLWPALEGRV